MRMFNGLMPYFDIPDSQSGGLSVEDMVEKLGETDEDEPPEKVGIEGSEDLLRDDKEKKPEREGKEKEDKEDKELELEEEKEPDEEELEDTQDVPRKEILKKYPTLFKDFPQLEKAYYREQKYAELLPTLEDAKTAVEKSNNYDKFENSLLSGNVDLLLSTVKSSDENAFAKIVDNYLPALQKADKGAYYHIVSNIGKNLIAGMVNEGNRLNNEALRTAAVVLNQFVFGTSEYTPPAKFSSEPERPNEEQTRLQQERQQFLQDRFDVALNDLSTSSNNIIKSTISKHIDPKEAMTDYVRKVAVNDALESVNKAIESDSRFKAQLDKLWERAFTKNFSRDSLEDIKRAYLNKAKTYLPDAIRKSRNEALKGLGKRITEDKEEPQKKGHVPVGRNTSADNRSKQEVPKGMKTIDFLMSD